MKKYILLIVATLCIAISSSAAVARSCDPSDPGDQITALALNMYFEARGDGKTKAERLQAMQMVGEVTLNRVASDNYPDSICEVVYQKHQFSWTKRKDKTPREIDEWLLAVELAVDLVHGNVEYFNNGATHFINPRGVKRMPRWTARLEKVGKVGSHIFYTDNSVRGDVIAYDLPVNDGREI
jgi:spore germination cell wall hydrolase CwlJ-like protein